MTTTPTPAAATPAAAPSGAVYSLAYRRYEGVRRSPAFAPLVIARYALVTQLRQRAVKVALLLGLLVLAVTAVVMGFKWALPSMLASAGGGSPEAARAAELLREGEGEVASVGLRAQSFHTFLLVLWCGAGAISADLTAGAFQFHFSRPVSPGRYLAGRLLSSSGWAVALSTVMIAVLTVERMAFQSTPLGAARAAAGGLAASLLLASVFAAVGLGLSSLTRRKGLAQAMFAGVIFSTWLTTGIVSGVTDKEWINGLDPFGSVVTMVKQWNGTLTLHGAPAAAPAAAWACWTGLSLALAAWQLSRAEVNRG